MPQFYELAHLLFLGASFSENFYGLKRVAVSQEMSSKLPSRAFWKSLVCLVGS